MHKDTLTTVVLSTLFIDLLTFIHLTKTRLHHKYHCKLHLYNQNNRNLLLLLACPAEFTDLIHGGNVSFPTCFVTNPPSSSQQLGNNTLELHFGPDLRSCSLHLVTNCKLHCAAKLTTVYHFPPVSLHSLPLSSLHEKPDFQPVTSLKRCS